MDRNENRITELYRTMDRVRRAWKSVTPCPALSKSQYGTLLSLCRLSMPENAGAGDTEMLPVPISALAASMHQSTPALSQRIRTLEELGYVERVPDPNDRRVIGVRLSAEGFQILEVARAAFRETMSRAISQLGPEETDRLIESLTALAGAFESAASDSDEEKRCRRP